MNAENVHREMVQSLWNLAMPWSGQVSKALWLKLILTGSHLRQSFAHRLGLRHWSLVHVDGIHLKMFVDCCDVIHYHMPVRSFGGNDIVQILQAW